MPYVVISTQIQLENGPTNCGDEESDKELMDYLGANLHQGLGDVYKSYIAQVAPRVILNKLEAIGFRVVASCGVGQTCIWTLFKEGEITLPS